MPSTYTTLKKGAQGASVSGLQNSLRNAGYQLNQSGVFDDATENAVKQYQKQNKLTVDGIAGNQTLNSLYGTGGQNTQYGYTPSANVMNAQKYLESLQANKPAAYQGKYGDQISSLIDQISNRQPFQYDVNTDPLYQMYKDQYIANGQRAMQDTMGQAAALTGGYGNSYAASAGQQAYNQTLEGLNNIIPQLQQQAYQRYNDEGDQMRANLSMLQGADESDYGRYRDTMADYLNERQLAENAYLNERNFDYGTFADWRNIQEQRAAEERNRDFQREMTAGDRDFQREMTDKGYDFQREMTAGDRDFQREMTAGDRDFQREMTDKGYDFQREMTAGDRDFQREMTNLGYDFEREMTDKGYDFQREMSGTEYDRELAAQTKDYAYRTAMAMISAGKMPSDELLAAAGLTKKDIDTWLAKPEVAPVMAGGGGTTTTKKKSSSKSSTTSTTAPKVDMAKETEGAQKFVDTLISESEFNKQRAGISQMYNSYQDYVEDRMKIAYESGKLDDTQVNMIVDAWNNAAKK